MRIAEFITHAEPATCGHDAAVEPNAEDVAPHGPKLPHHLHRVCRPEDQADATNVADDRRLCSTTRAPALSTVC